MKDSGIDFVDTIPLIWKEIKLKYLCYLRARLGWRGLKADEYVEQGYIFLSAFNIINNKLNFDNVNYINQFRYDESPVRCHDHAVLCAPDRASVHRSLIVLDVDVVFK